MNPYVDDNTEEVISVGSPREASQAVAAANSDAHATLPFDDTHDVDDAARGLIAKLDPAVISRADGATAWDCDEFGFLAEDCPPTANPSLWRQSGLVAQQGLFEVADRI